LKVQLIAPDVPATPERKLTSALEAFKRIFPATSIFSAGEIVPTPNFPYL
jgi:hypothetical protein